jgi:amino acid transporter
MDNSQVNKPKRNILLTIIMIVEIIILFAMLLYASYLILGISVLKIAQKTTSNSSASTNKTSTSDCPAGKEGTNEQGEHYKVLGLEDISVDGQAYNLCCAQSSATNQEVKVCSDKANSVVVMYSKVNGQFILANEMFTRDGKKCTKYYQGSAKSGEICL